MRLLLISGFAWKHAWGLWLLLHSHRYDLVVFTGDLFASRVTREADLQTGLLWLKIITAKLAPRTWLALGTGVGDEQICFKFPGKGRSFPDWQSLVPEVAAKDGMNQVMAGQQGRILVSVFGSHMIIGENKCARFMQWREAQKIAQNFKLPWLVLQPFGPAGTAVTQWFNPHTGEYEELGSGELAAEIEQYQPDFVVSGCPDHAPFEGGHWCDWIGRTLVLNTGCRPCGAFPCHIELDLERQRARWRVPGLEDAVVALDANKGSSPENSQPSHS